MSKHTVERIRCDICGRHMDESDKNWGSGTQQFGCTIIGAMQVSVSVNIMIANSLTDDVCDSCAIEILRAVLDD